MAPVLGYWNLRGLVMPIKYVLEHAGVEYEDKVYKLSPPDYNRDEWLGDKFTLGLDFPNLPYYIDGDVKLSQSMAILRYVAEKHGLAGSTPEERAIVDMAVCQMFDLRLYMTFLCYKDWSEENKVTFLNETVPNSLKSFEQFLAGKKLVLGDKVSYADFYVWESLDMLLYMAPDLLKDYPSVQAFYNNVAELPRMKSYLASDRCIKFPLNGPIAKWGGKMEDQKLRYPNA